MKLNTLKPHPKAKKNVKRLGRGIGSGLGKTSGRGHKGQKARSGGGPSVGFEGGQMPLYRRLPKFGFNSYKARVTAEVRLNEIAKLTGDNVNLQILKEQGVINKQMKYAKIILSGKLDKAMTIQGLRVTKGAKAAIEACGGKVEE